MYTKKTFPITGLLMWTRRSIYVFIILSTIPVILFDVLKWHWLHLPWLPIGVLGTAVAFIVGFKNNASYDRLWEARKIWGGIINASRSFTIMLNDYITNEHASPSLEESALHNVRKEMVMRHIAWMTSLRHALRTQKPWEASHENHSDQEYMKGFEIQEWKYSLEQALEGYVSDEDKLNILSKTNKQTACITLQSKQLKELKMKGLIEDFRHMEMQNMLVEFLSLQGKAERIKNFPYPRQFATLNYVFVAIFAILLPFGMMHEFHKIGLEIVQEIVQSKPYPEGSYQYIIEYIGRYFVWFTIPFSVIITWVFHTMERIGEVTENPFEGNPNDVPITTMARAIEIDIRQMIDDDPKDIPQPIEEIADIQF